MLKKVGTPWLSSVILFLVNMFTSRHPTTLISSRCEGLGPHQANAQQTAYVFLRPPHPHRAARTLSSPPFSL